MIKFIHIQDGNRQHWLNLAQICAVEYDGTTLRVKTAADNTEAYTATLKTPEAQTALIAALGQPMPYDTIVDDLPEDGVFYFQGGPVSVLQDAHEVEVFLVDTVSFFSSAQARTLAALLLREAAKVEAAKVEAAK